MSIYPKIIDKKISSLQAQLETLHKHQIKLEGSIVFQEQTLQELTKQIESLGLTTEELPDVISKLEADIAQRQAELSNHTQKVQDVITEVTNVLNRLGK